MLAYASTLEALGLVPGEIEPAPKCERPCRLAAPEASWSRPFREGEWTPASVPSALADRLVPDRATRCGCLPIRFETLRYEGRAEAVKLAPRADGALILRQDGSIHHVGRDHQITRLCGPFDVFHAGYASTETSTVWLAGTRFGSVDLRQAHPDAPCPFREGPALPASAPIIALDGPREASPFELYALSSSGSFARFDGRAWTGLVSLAPPPPQAQRGSVLWTAPRSAAAVNEGHEVARASDGTARIETVHIDIDSYGFESIGISARFGLLLAAYHVGVLAETPAGWEVVGEARRTNSSGFLVELDDHLFSAWPLGVVGQLVSGRETCADAYSGLQRLHRLATPLGAQEILIAVEASEEDVESYLIVMSIEAGCS